MASLIKRKLFGEVYCPHCGTDYDIEWGGTFPQNSTIRFVCPETGCGGVFRVETTITIDSIVYEE